MMYRCDNDLVILRKNYSAKGRIFSFKLRTESLLEELRFCAMLLRIPIETRRILGNIAEILISKKIHMVQ